MTSDGRYDLFTPVHKGLRAALFDGGALLARTDFAARGEAALAAHAVDRVLAFLEEHAGHEDAVILPALAELSPEMLVAIREDHARLDGLQRELAGLAARLAGGSEVERVAVGHRVGDRFNLLVAEQLRHMQREEGEVQRLLCAHRSDGELRVLHGRILGRIPAPRSAEWMALILPSLSAPERAALSAAASARS